MPKPVPNKVLIDLAAKGVLDLSGQYVPSQGGILVKPETASEQKVVFKPKPTAFSESEKSFFHALDTAEMKAKPVFAYRPPKDNIGKDRQLDVLKAMLASFLVGREDCTVEIAGADVDHFSKDFPVEVIWFPDSNKYVARLR
jgi:hypothetical protein